MLDNILFLLVGAMGASVYFLWHEKANAAQPQQNQEKKDRNTEEGILPIIEDMYEEGMLNTGQIRAYSKAQHGGARLRANTKTLTG